MHACPCSGQPFRNPSELMFSKADVPLCCTPTPDAAVRTTTERRRQFSCLFQTTGLGGIAGMSDKPILKEVNHGVHPHLVHGGGPSTHRGRNRRHIAPAA